MRLPCREIFFQAVFEINSHVWRQEAHLWKAMDHFKFTSTVCNFHYQKKCWFYLVHQIKPSWCTTWYSSLGYIWMFQNFQNLFSHLVISLKKKIFDSSKLVRHEHVENYLSSNFMFEAFDIKIYRSTPFCRKTNCWCKTVCFIMLSVCIA